MNLLFESYMIKISEILKQISNGLACQYAGDCLSRKEKISLLSVHSKLLKKDEDNVVEFVSADHEDMAQSVDIPERSAA
jgi:hypothetical protein